MCACKYFVAARCGISTLACLQTRHLPLATAELWWCGGNCSAAFRCKLIERASSVERTGENYNNSTYSQVDTCRCGFPVHVPIYLSTLGQLTF